MDLRWTDDVYASGDLAGFLDRLRGEVMMSSNILAMIADFAVMMMLVMMMVFTMCVMMMMVGQCLWGKEGQTVAQKLRKIFMLRGSSVSSNIQLSSVHVNPQKLTARVFEVLLIASSSSNKSPYQQ